MSLGGGGGGAAYYWRSFALQKWFSLYLKGILHLAIWDFTPENVERGGKWVQGGGIELPCKYSTTCVLLKKYKHIVRDAIQQKQQ